MKPILSIQILIAVAIAGCTDVQNKSPEPPQARFEPTWTSLQRHDTPQWLKDAKFGIYTHVSLDTIKNTNDMTIQFPKGFAGQHACVFKINRRP